MNTTTKRFARTLDEAFPHGPEYGCSITRYGRARMPLSDKVLFIVGVIGIVIAIVFNNYS